MTQLDIPNLPLLAPGRCLLYDFILSSCWLAWGLVSDWLGDHEHLLPIAHHSLEHIPPWPYSTISLSLPSKELNNFLAPLNPLFQVISLVAPCVMVWSYWLAITRSGVVSLVDDCSITSFLPSSRWLFLPSDSVHVESVEILWLAWTTCLYAACGAGRCFLQLSQATQIGLIWSLPGRISVWGGETEPLVLPNPFPLSTVNGKKRLTSFQVNFIQGLVALCSQASVIGYWIELFSFNRRSPLPWKRGILRPVLAVKMSNMHTY